MRKVWIEAALNGGWSRALQPGIPDTVETIIAEGVACARAGATIIHVHAYDGGGPQTHDWQVYARIIEGIRNQVDVPVYPSYPAFTTDGDASLADVRCAIAHIEALVARGLIDFALIDPGSANFTPDNDDIGCKARRHLHESRRPCPVCARFCRAARTPSRFRDLRARLHARRRGAGPRGRHEGSDLPSHVLQPASRSAFRQGRMRSRLTCRCWRRKRPARPG